MDINVFRDKEGVCYIMVEGYALKAQGSKHSFEEVSVQDIPSTAILLTKVDKDCIEAFIVKILLETKLYKHAGGSDFTVKASMNAFLSLGHKSVYYVVGSSKYRLPYSLILSSTNGDLSKITELISKLLIVKGGNICYIIDECVACLPEAVYKALRSECKERDYRTNKLVALVEYFQLKGYTVSTTDTSVTLRKWHTIMRILLASDIASFEYKGNTLVLPLQEYLDNESAVPHRGKFTEGLLASVRYMNNTNQ